MTEDLKQRIKNAPAPRYHCLHNLRTGGIKVPGKNGYITARYEIEGKYYSGVPQIAKAFGIKERKVSFNLVSGREPNWIRIKTHRYKG